MGEVEEQRYVCKICSKRCVSGKSLGGHMRVHLAQIAASKKAAAAAQQKAAEIKIECIDNDDQLKESCIDQSNSEEKMEEFGDGDQSNSYELRENPKKSWRISDPKHPLIAKAANSCRECGKEFASLRALSGHMRCHSIKNKKEVHLCRECGRGFDSMRAMFGHMKSHSKRLMKVSVESGESLSDLENFCPIRRKRSRIRYKGTVNPSFSGADAFDCGVSEIEEAARCLVMLSRGVGSFLKYDENAEDDDTDDDDDYFGGVVTSCGSVGDFAADDEMKMKLKLKVKMKATSLSYIERNVGGEFVDDGEKKFKAASLSYTDDFDMKFVGGDQTKVDDDDDDEMFSVENGMKVDLDLLCDDEFMESDESCFGKKSSENGADPELMEGFEQTAECKRRQRVLGSQNGRYKIVGTSSDLHINANLLSVDLKHDQCGGGEDRVEQETESSKGREHECPICFKVFASGQALGGHKRAHYNGVVESKNPEMLDLNFPVPGEAGARSGGGLGISSWFVERSHEHERLLLTT